MNADDLRKLTAASQQDASDIPTWWEAYIMPKAVEEANEGEWYSRHKISMDLSEDQKNKICEFAKELGFDVSFSEGWVTVSWALPAA